MPRNEYFLRGNGYGKNARETLRQEKKSRACFGDDDIMSVVIVNEYRTHNTCTRIASKRFSVIMVGAAVGPFFTSAAAVDTMYSVLVHASYRYS